MINRNLSRAATALSTSAIHFCLLHLIVTSAVTGFTLPENKKLLSDKIIGMMLLGQFERALTVSDSLAQADPQDPLPPVLHLATMGMRDLDFDETVDSTGFLISYDRAVTRIGQYQKTHGISAYTRTLEGFSKAIHSSFYLKSKAYIPALKTGTDALDILRDARVRDPDNTDVNFFLGLYDYAKGDLKKRLWWVMFWYPGDKKSGIEQLESASKSAQLTRVAARLSLSDIYLNEKLSEKSLQIIEQLNSDHPGSRFVLWGKVKYFENLGHWSRAAELYGELAESYAGEEHGVYNHLVTLNKKANMLFLAGETDSAIQTCNLVIKGCARGRCTPLRKDSQRLLEKIHAGKN